VRTIALVTRTHDELLELFEEQVGFLERSNELFDTGHLSEAKRLSVPLRAIFHESKFSRYPLIKQLGLENTLTWVDTAGLPDPRKRLPHTGLFQMGINIENGKGEPVLQAPLSDYPPSLMRTTGPLLPRGSRIYFEAWWNNSVMKDSEGTEFSRREFVLDLCNKEGGAHIDPVSPAAYRKLAKGNSMGWVFRQGDGPEQPLSNPVLYAMRQISYEVVESVRLQRDRIK
jgi:hypothetical protein